ncbi:prolipoprotein diacylglyceryl transferase [candidate division KSB1 bacterium]|nr:prolipoprotein diacylglyceryl transferase [candidate division KSB1 bacterium]
MFPVLVKIGAFELRSFGLALAISVAFGIWASMKRAPRFGVKPEDLLDLTIVLMLAAIIGSRFWYVVYHVDEAPQVLATLGAITINANHLLLLLLFIGSVYFLIRGFRKQP